MIPGLLLLLLASPAAAASCPEFGGARLGGSVRSERVSEASGLVVSRAQKNVLWVHNDSGHVPRVYAVGIDGTDLGSYQLRGAGNTDWEDLALGPGPEAGRDYLYVGDIGDNEALRESIAVYRVPEPKVVVGDEIVHVEGTEVFELRYPDGPRDAETLLVDPDTGDLYVITKATGPSQVFRAAAPLAAGAPIALREVARVGLSGGSFFGTAITGGDLSDRALVLRGHAVANWWSRTPGQPLEEVLKGPACVAPLAFPNELQGEALGLAPDSRRYYTIGEGKGVGVWRFERSD